MSLQCVATPPLAFCAVASAFIMLMAVWHIVGAVYVFRQERNHQFIINNTVSILLTLRHLI